MSEKEEYRKQLDDVINHALEQLAMLNYNKKIKGCLVLVIDHNHVFRLIEAYGSDTAIAMNAAMDIAKGNLMKTIGGSLIAPEIE